MFTGKKLIFSRLFCTVSIRLRSLDQPLVPGVFFFFFSFCKSSAFHPLRGNSRDWKFSHTGVSKKWNWLDQYVRNESQYTPLAYFPLYIFGISFIKWKRMATHQNWSKLYETFFCGYLDIYTALSRWLERVLKFLENPDTLMPNYKLLLSWFMLNSFETNKDHFNLICIILNMPLEHFGLFRVLRAWF